MADPHGTNEASSAAAAVLDIARIVLSEGTLESVLHRVAEAARRSMPSEAQASVTLLLADLHTAASTADLAADLDAAQYARNEGPCLDASRTGHVNLIDDMETELRWPSWTGVAVATGVRSSLSVPMPVHDRVVGALNIYSRHPCAFDDDTIEIARGFASYAGVAVANAELYAATASQATNLEAAMASRSVIEQAKGILMALHGIDADAAFSLLAKESQEGNRKLRDVAVQLVEQTRRSV